MKGVIVDIEGRYAVALTKNGEFVKLRNSSDYKVGCEVDVSSSPLFSARSLVKYASIAASFLLALGVGYGAYSYNAPYSYVNIDINPSIEVTTNVYNRVIDVKGLNRDGMEVLASSESYKNKNVKDAVEGVLKSAVEKGFFKDDVENAVMLTVSSKSQKKTEEIEENIEDTAVEELGSADVDTDVIVEKVTIARHEAARDIGISPGKLLLIEKLKESAGNTKAINYYIDDYRDAPVREIMKQIISYKKQGIVNEKSEEVPQKDQKDLNTGDSSTDGNKDKGSNQDKENADKNNSDKKTKSNNASNAQGNSDTKATKSDNKSVVKENETKEKIKVSSGSKQDANSSSKVKGKAKKYSLTGWIEEKVNGQTDNEKQKDKLNKK